MIDRDGPPLSRVSSKGGMVVGCWKETAPSVLLETQGRGMAGGLMETVPPSRVSSGGGGWGGFEGHSPLRLARNAREKMVGGLEGNSPLRLA